MARRNNNTIQNEGTIINELRKTNDLLEAKMATNSDRACDFRGYFYNNRGTGDFYTIAGWEKDLGFGLYLEAYKRNSIARAVLNAYPENTWRDEPVIQDDDSSDEFTEFESSWRELSKKIKFKTNAKRADLLSGIGEYGCLFLGFNDISSESGFKNEVTENSELLYVKPKHKNDCLISEYDTDPASERYGYPKYYNMNIGTSSQIRTSRVHWSRVVHIPSNDYDDVEGNPRLEGCYNDCFGIQMIAAYSDAGYQGGANPGIAVEFESDATPPDEKSQQQLETILRNYQNNAKRFIAMGAGKVKTLAPNVTDPLSFTENHLQLISAETRIPKRILLGTEQGVLAGDQDSDAFLRVVDSRRENYCTMYIVQGLIDRLIAYGTLPQPKNNVYSVIWPNMFEDSPLEKASLAKTRAETLKILKETVNVDEDFDKRQRLTEFLGYTDEEADAIIAATEDNYIQGEKNLSVNSGDCCK